jgi:hypothetical protein
MNGDTSWPADSRSADQEIPRLLHDPKVHYRVRKIPPLDLFSISLNQSTASQRFFFNNYFNIILLLSIPRPVSLLQLNLL